MEFYGLLELDSRNRVDVSLYFDSGSKIVFSYDSEKDVFVARRIFGNESVRPVWAKVGEVLEVKKTGFLPIPDWILQISPGKIEKMLISPVYSEAHNEVSEIRMRPVCSCKAEELAKALARANSEDQSVDIPPAWTENLKRLSGLMLKSAFGEDFDAEAGKEETPLSAYTDDF